MMNQTQSAQAQQGWQTVSNADIEERLAFIRKTYIHLAGAVVFFVLLMFSHFQSGLAQAVIPLMTSSGMAWMLTLGLFMAVGWGADYLARSSHSTRWQYAGLGLYVFAESILFLPLMLVATQYSSPDVLPSAAVTTLSVFSVLTGYVFVTKKDFSFMGPFLAIAGMGAFALIGISMLFGFNLGVFFGVAMVILAAGYIVYYTSNILHHYNTNQHVAASLALFASLALLFYYVLQLFVMGDQ
jgi:FtsH-binding integral membrane protein